VNPAQSALYVGQARRDSAPERGIGCNTVPRALDDARKSQSRVRHDVNVRSHAWLDMLQLRLAEIRQHPPDARVDQRENLLSYVSISALGNDEVGYTCVEWSVDAALVVVVLGVVDCRGASLPLGHKGIEGKYAGLRLVKLCRTLLRRRLRLRQGGQHGVEVGSIESQLRFGFVHVLRAGPLRSTCLVHLVDGNELLDQQRLDAVQVIFGVCPFGLGSIQRSLGVGDIGLRLTDRGLRSVDIGAGAAGCRSRGGDGVDFGLNAALFVDDLAFKGGLVRH
jgi:hypothetical protein